MSGFVEIALFSDDVDAATRFYARALGVQPVSEWPGGAIFAVGGLKLLVHERAGETAGGPPNEDHVAIGVDDLDRAYTELADAGYGGLAEPREYPWGRSAYLRDPDGRLVELASG